MIVAKKRSKFINGRARLMAVAAQPSAKLAALLSLLQLPIASVLVQS